MHIKSFYTKVIVLIMILFCLSSYASYKDSSFHKILIVLAAPRSNELYYKEMYAEIIQFQIAYAKQIMHHDHVLILVDNRVYRIFSKYLPKSILLKIPMQDIWIRDFSPVIPSHPLQFIYTKVAQGGDQKRSDQVQHTFNQFTKQYHLRFATAHYKLDGGNVVDNNKDKLVVTEKFLKDNNLTYEQGKHILKKLTGYTVAIIPSDDPDGLAHADGMLMFVEDNTIVLNSYATKEFGNLEKKITKELYASFPKIHIVKVRPVFDNKVWDKNYSSACGINVNAVVTKHFIYMPNFGTKHDQQVANIIQQHTSKKVISIPSNNICKMGGSVRCLSWQVMVQNAIKFIK